MELYIIAGPNGVGKTTLATKFLPNYADCQNFINADLIAPGISPFAPEVASVRAGRLVLSEIKRLAARRASFAFETRLSGKLFEIDSAAEETGIPSALLLPVGEECRCSAV